MFFSNEKRPKLKLENPGASIGDIAKKLGEQWKKMTPEQKIPFDEMAKKDKERYLEELNQLKQNEKSGSAKDNGGRGRKKKKVSVKVVEEEEEEEDEEEEEEEEEEDSSD